MNNKTVNVDFVTRAIEIDLDGKEHFIAASLAAEQAIKAKEESVASAALIKARKALWYESVAAMKADNSINAGSYVNTAGYYTANDGGGGSYIIRAKAVEDVEDGDSIHYLQKDLVAELIDTYIPRKLVTKTKPIKVKSNQFVEKQKTDQGIIVDSTAYNETYTIKDTRLSKKGIDITKGDYGVLENIAFYNCDKGIFADTTEWVGAIIIDKCRFRRIDGNAISLNCGVSTHTFLLNSCFEFVRRAVKTNGELNIQNCYFGDVGNDLDENQHNVTVDAQPKSDVRINNSKLGISARNYSDGGTVIVELNGTDDNQCKVAIEDCVVSINNQYASQVYYSSALFRSLSKNNEIWLDNVLFKPSNDTNHCPFYLQEYKNLYSKKPLINYAIGGLFRVQNKLKFLKGDLNVYENKIQESPYYGLINAYGGDLLRIYGTKKLVIPYHIPKHLVGREMTVIVDGVGTVGSGAFTNLGILYSNSDCKNSGTYSKQIAVNPFYKAPYRNFIAFTPSKEYGVITFYHNSPVELAYIIANVMLVEDSHKYLLGDYNDYDDNIYSATKPTTEGFEGEIVYNINNPITGWIYQKGTWVDYPFKQEVKQ